LFRPNATKSPAEREEEQIQQQVKPAPKQKPPRYDRRNKRLDVEDDDLENEDKDLSMNYKDIGGSETALDEAICLVAMKFRGIAPDGEDTMLIKRSLGTCDLTDARSYPKVATAVLSHMDAKYKHARLRRVYPTSDMRRFEMTEPMEPRDLEDPLWPVSTKVVLFKPAYVNEDDLNRIMKEALGSVDPTLLKYNKDIALREALDMTLRTLNGGKYEHTLDAPTYLSVLTKLADEDLDLTKDTYLPEDYDPNPTIKYLQGEPFDPHDWWGRPVRPVETDVHKNDEWKKHFEHAGPYEYESDEAYMENFKNPTV